EGKALFARAGILLPERTVATTPQEAADAAERLGGHVAVKVQVPMGGRGQGGGGGLRPVARGGCARGGADARARIRRRSRDTRAGRAARPHRPAVLPPDLPRPGRGALPAEGVERSGG